MSFGPEKGKTGDVSPRTVGYVVWGSDINMGTHFRPDGSATWLYGTPTVHRSVEDAIAAIVRAVPGVGHIGTLTIKKVVETTYSETRTEYQPL